MCIYVDNKKTKTHVIWSPLSILSPLALPAKIFSQSFSWRNDINAIASSWYLSACVWHDSFMRMHRDFLATHLRVCVCVCVCSCVCVSLKRVLHVEWHINVPAPGTGWQRPIGCLFFDDKAQSPKKRLWLASLWRKEHSKYHVHLQNLYISHADRKINKYAQFMQTTCQIHTIHASTKKIYNSCTQYIWRTHTHVYYCSRSSSSARAYTCRHYCAWQSTQNMGNTRFIHTTCMHRIYKYITVHEVALLLELVDVERKRLSCLKTCESKHGK